MDDVTIPLAAGGQVRVIRADHARHGWVYLSIEGARAPDVDGVASLDDAARRALLAALAVSNKFGAKGVEVDGYSFASKAEARRYGELKLLEAAGAIRDLWVHPRFELSVNGVRIGWYTADFRYTDNDTDAVIVEDVKGGRATKTEAYGLRKKLMKALHGIDITEIAV